MRLPETMHPLEMTESRAWPHRRPCSANTNFAGGAWGRYVRSGHSGSYRLNSGFTWHKSMLASKYASRVPMSRQYFAAFLFSS